MNSSPLDAVQDHQHSSLDASVTVPAGNPLPEITPELTPKFTARVNSVITPAVTKQQLEKRQMRLSTKLWYLLLYVVAGGVVYGAFQLWLNSFINLYQFIER
ncbi:MAG: hypothetical protein VYA84_15450 [Planctomycetota bacterium]|nr:hypothetical protein [Planctomycetota bacterium]